MRIRVAPDAETLARQARDAVLGALGEAVRRRGRAYLAVAGGRTPRRTYELLGGDGRLETLPGSADIEVTDERFVGPESAESNFRMVEETLLASGRVPREWVHSIRTSGEDVESAARQYESELRTRLPALGPSFDLVVLGLGPDGHTASLFPDAPELEETVRWVVAVNRSPQPPFLPRITLTLPLLNRSRRVWFLVTGASKSTIVRRVIEGPTAGSGRLPASLVHGTESTEWFLDAPAAQELARGIRGTPDFPEPNPGSESGAGSQPER